jgi:hypothetical protein
MVVEIANVPNSNLVFDSLRVGATAALGAASGKVMVDQVEHWSEVTN